MIKGKQNINKHEYKTNKHEIQKQTWINPKKTNSDFLFKKLNVGIDMGSRVALVGQNGAGKNKRNMNELQTNQKQTWELQS